jgi:hypothetical protein
MLEIMKIIRKFWTFPIKLNCVQRYWNTAGGNSMPALWF